MGILTRLGLRSKRVHAERIDGRTTAIRIRGKPFKSFKTQIIDDIRLQGAHGVVRFYKVKVGRKIIRCMAIKHPSFYRPSSDVENDFKMLNEMKQNPQLKEYIPHTVRLIREEKEYSLLLTDLTHGGKFQVINKNLVYRLANRDDVEAEIERLRTLLRQERYPNPYDIFLIQVRPDLNWGVKVWIVDVGYVFQRAPEPKPKKPSKKKKRM